jgi:hypothetical protein
MTDVPAEIRYISPHQLTLMTAISRDKLNNLVKAGILKAKRVDERTVVIELDSVIAFLKNLPDVTMEEDHVAQTDPIKSYKAEYRKAMDLFSEEVSK